MKIFTIIISVVIAVIAGVFLRISWKNYKEEEIILTKYWPNTIPSSVTQPFSFGVFLFLMAIFCLTIIFT